MNLSDSPICIVIPAFRAEKQIARVLSGIPPFVSWIVVVEDASPDATAQVVAGLAARDPRIRFIRHAQNQGVGGAMLTGYAEAHRLGAQVVVKMDSDDQMDPVYLPQLLRPILTGEADYTKGNRFLHTHHLQSMPLLRQVGNIGLSFLAKIASGYWNVFDPSNGYTALHTALVPDLLQGEIDRRYYFETSMLQELGLMRAVVRDVPIPARYQDEHSSLSELDTLLKFPPKLVRGFARRLWIQYFVRDFTAFSLLSIIGMIFGVFGLLWGIFHWARSIQTGVAATTGTVMLAVLPLILGVQFLLQALLLDIQNTPKDPLHKQL